MSEIPLLKEGSSSCFIIQIIMTSLIFLFGIPLLWYTIKTRSSFPYNNASPFWIIVIVLLSLLIQALNLLFTILINVYIDQNNHSTFTLIRKNTILITNMIMFITIIARLFSIKCCIEFNYDKLSIQYSRESLSRKTIPKLFYTRKFIFFKRFLIIFILYIMSAFIYFSINFDMTVKDTSIEFLYFNSNITSLSPFNYVDIFIPYIIYSTAFVFMVIFVAEIMKFPLKADKFKIKVEIFGVSILTYIFFNIKVIFILFFGKQINLYNKIYTIDSLFPLSLIAIYCYITLYRHWNFENIKVNDILNDFDEFTHRYITFKLFKSYVQENFPHHITFLSFLIDYYSYKEILEKVNSERRDNQNITVHKKEMKKLEQELARKGKEIYLYYFGNIDTSRNATNSLAFESKFEKSDTADGVVMDIPFPIDIFEKVKEAYDSSFSQDNVETIYDEPFAWIKQELLKDFEHFKNQREETMGLEKIMFFVTIFEII